MRERAGLGGRLGVRLDGCTAGWSAGRVGKWLAGTVAGRLGGRVGGRLEVRSQFPFAAAVTTALYCLCIYTRIYM